MWPKIVVPKDIVFSHKHTLRCFTETPLHTVVNPAALECPQRVVLISIFIEMLSKPLRATRSNQCCLGSVLHRQASTLLLLLFVFMPFALIPLKGRWWSHTSVIPASEEWLSLDCMLTEYIYPSMCFNWQSIYSEHGRALQEHVKEHLTLCCTESLPCSICLYYFWQFNHLPISTVSHRALQKQQFDWWRSSDRLNDQCSCSEA